MKTKEAVYKISKIKHISCSDKKVIQSAIRAIASMCDGAHDLDGCGFNKNDSYFGKSIASQSSPLSHRQAAVALRLAYKYRKQLQDGMAVAIESIINKGDSIPSLDLPEEKKHGSYDILIIPLFVGGSCRRIYVVSRSKSKEIASFSPEEWSTDLEKNLYKKGLKSVDIEEISGIVSINN